MLRYFDACYTTTRAYHTRIPVLVLRAAERQPPVQCCDKCAERLAPKAAPVDAPAPADTTAGSRAAYHGVPWV